MATRSRTTFNKRQKELARLEKQRDKAAKRLQRKQERTPLVPESEMVLEPREPLDLDEDIDNAGGPGSDPESGAA